jgi:hypothetical protein
MKHSFSRLLLVYRRCAYRASIASRRRVVARAAQAIGFGGVAVFCPFFFSCSEVRGYAVGHGDKLYQQEVQAGCVDEREGGVDVGCGRCIGRRVGSRVGGHIAESRRVEEGLWRYVQCAELESRGGIVYSVNVRVELWGQLRSFGRRLAECSRLLASWFSP